MISIFMASPSQNHPTLIVIMSAGRWYGPQALDWREIMVALCGSNMASWVILRKSSVLRWDMPLIHGGLRCSDGNISYI